MSPLWTSIVVLLANAALLVLQLVGGRRLSPYIGSSLETWTAVIGVILLGISLGNAWGGRLADRSGTSRTLRRVLALAGLVTLAELAITESLGGSNLLAGIPLLPRIALMTSITLFPPAFVLSLTTPLAIRLMLPGVESTGRVVGRIYALGTLGSLLGNFLTGFVLMAHLGTHTITAGVGVMLLALAMLTPANDTVREVTPLVPGPVEGSAPGDEDLDIPTACLTVFVASFASMSLELTASRMAAPMVGVSLVTWTAIIGVVLVGIAAGNWIGGALADRRPSREVLGFTQLIAGLAIVFGIIMWSQFARTDWTRDFHVILRTLLLTSFIYLPALVVLSTVSPQATRLAVRDVAHAGRVAGTIYAWSCAGAILGTFTTGWWLIASVGVLQLLFLLAVILFALSVLAGRGWRKPLEMVVSLTVAAGALGYLHVNKLNQSPFSLESRYYAIRITEKADTGGFSLRSMALDHLVHSIVRGRPEGPDGEWRADPSFLGYPHEKVQGDFCMTAAAATAEPRILVIGGGGYTMPRWIEAMVPEALCEVVEIDPAVTEVSHLMLGLPRETKIRSYHFDARQFVVEVARPGTYDLVMQDAVNDLSVPAHLMTREYNEAIARLLKPEGAYLLTVIDDWREGRLYRSALATMKQTFPHVSVVMHSPDAWGEVRQVIMVLYGSRSMAALEKLHTVVKARTGKPTFTAWMPQAGVEQVIAERPHTVLTDAYGPVDNLMLGVLNP